MKKKTININYTVKNNSILQQAKNKKNDEFYTYYKDIEKEFSNYINFFENKIIYCNCDNPKKSNFYKYFYDNFNKFKLKELIATYLNEKKTYVTRYNGNKERKSKLKGNGDFRSNECIELLKYADIIATNPPYSLFREYIRILVENNKKFIVLGNQTAISTVICFEYFYKKLFYFGINSVRNFFDENGENRNTGHSCWYSNIDFNIFENKNDIILTKKYDENYYEEYDNYNAINVNKVCDIPMDYEGIMGVPVNFAIKHNGKQFILIGSDFEVANGRLDYLLKNNYKGKKNRGFIKGKEKFHRLFIKLNKNNFVIKE